METIRLTDLIVEFLSLSSLLLFILGVLSALVLRVLKIQGKPKLWICTLLVIMPLVYPIQALFPDLIKVPISLKTYQSMGFEPFDTTTDENPVSKGVSFLTTNGASADQTTGKETGKTVPFEKRIPLVTDSIQRGEQLVKNVRITYGYRLHQRTPDLSGLLEIDGNAQVESGVGGYPRVWIDFLDGEGKVLERNGLRLSPWVRFQEKLEASSETAGISFEANMSPPHGPSTRLP